jgi:hypothetical protein
MSRQGTIILLLHQDLVAAQEVQNEEGVAQLAVVGPIEGEKFIMSSTLLLLHIGLPA